jgi:hypothetical protein
VRQRALIATISRPPGPVPRANDLMPHTLQNRWWTFSLLNR